MQNNIEILHHQAMELVDRSILAKQQGDEAGSLELLRSAFEQERFSSGEASPTAANLVADQLDFEPTRSVLHRSAASLAVECCQLWEAELLMSYEICCWMRCIRSGRRFDV
jgi:hypothetical protein